MAVEHLSLYQLTIEDGTAFGDRFARGLLRGLPDEDLSADMYLRTQEICESAGLAAYEVSNHARDRAESRHNLVYWRSGDYVGIGPGAHGRLTLGGQRWATEAPRAPGAWLALVESGLPGEDQRTPVSGPERALEYLMMALRLREGLDVGRYESLAGTALNPKKLSHLIADGMVTLTDGRLSATASGRMVLNAVIRDLAEVSG